MRREIKEKTQGNGQLSWEIKEFDFRFVNKVIGQDVIKDENDKIISITDIFEKDANGKIIQEEKEVLVNAYITFDAPTREVASWKLRAILKSTGLFTQVEAALNSLQEPTKTIALEAWEYSATINQFSQTTKLIQQACALTDGQVEEIFTNAENINI